MSRPSYFDRSRNLQINGDVNFISSGGSAEDDPRFFHVSQRVQASNAQSRTIDQGFKILCDNTAPSARYGYGHSFKGPQCHPGTRVAVQDHIFKWFEDEDEQIAMWMHGPVGIGKSAIAQTVAHLAAERDQLSSAFFFFRSDETRNTAEHLVATLAYEMIRQIPHTCDRVCETIGSDPLVFSSPLEHQIEFTLLRPTRTSESSPRRRLIVIDGLDECLDIHMQQVIIRSFISTFLSMVTDTIPHKILIASRPESQIASAFSTADICPHVKRLALDSWDMEDDIQSFLRAKLDDIQQTHPLRRHLPYIWPDLHSFCRLLDRSVGSFAYASVAIRHLSSHNNNPEHALRDLLSIQPTQVAAAFADLDALYCHILLSLDPKLRFVLQKILCLHIYSQGLNSTIRSLAAALLEDRSTIELVLIRVSSLIKIDKYIDWIEFHHTSFGQFLCDEARAGDFYAFSPNVTSTVVAALSNLWLQPISDKRDYVWFRILSQNWDTYEPSKGMTRQILNTLIKTKLPTSFLYPHTVGTSSQMCDIDEGAIEYIFDFFNALQKPLACEELADIALFNQAFDVTYAWLRSHIDIVFKDMRAAMEIIEFLVHYLWGSRSRVNYESPSFQIFRRFVENENKEQLLLSASCIFRVFPEMKYTDFCHAIIDRFIALPSSQRQNDIRWYSWSYKITLSHFYFRVLDPNNPTTPSVCQRLEQILSAEHKALGPVIGSSLTSEDYLLGFFSGNRCYIDRDGQLVTVGYKRDDSLTVPDGMKLQDYVEKGVFKIAETTNLYIQRGHAENDFAYISAEVEASCKQPIQKRPSWESTYLSFDLNSDSDSV